MQESEKQALPNRAVAGPKVDRARGSSGIDEPSATGTAEGPAGLSALVSQLPGIVYRCEAKLPWRMCYISDAVEAITGYPPEDFLAQRLFWADLVHPDDLSGIADKLGADTAAGERFSLDYRIRHRDGGTRWVAEQGVVVERGPEGMVLEGFIQDRTEARLIESALRTGKARLSTVFDQALVGILHRDRSGRTIQVNRGLCSILGRSAQELVRLPISQLWHPDDAEKAARMHDQHAKYGTPYSTERRYLRPDGSVVWCDIQVSFVRGDDGEIDSSIVVVVDTTRRRQVDEQRIRALDMLRMALQGAEAGTFELSLEDYSVRLSPEAVRIYGLPDSHDGKLTHRDWLELVNPEDAARPPLLFADAGSAPAPRAFEFRLREQNGTVRWLRTLSHPVPADSGESPRVVGLVFDDTERKEAEQKLQASEAHLRLVQEAAHIGSYHVGPDLVTIGSRQYYRNLGLSEETRELPEEAYLALIHPEDRQRVAAESRAATSSCDESLEMEFRVIRASDGEVRWMLNRTRYLRDGSGRMVGALGAHMDITERRQAEEAARAGEALNLSIIEASADGITLLDANGRTTFMNRHGLAAAGVEDFASLEGRPWADCWPVQVQASLKAAVAQAQEGGVGRFTGCNRATDGSEKWWDVAVTPVRGDSGAPTALLAISRDVTEQRRSAERARWAAGHDAMTGLPNRRFFQEQLQEALRQARADGERVGLLILDIDHFKEVNDERGHDAGDALLRVFAERLRKAVNPADTVARLGGDEFAVILRQIDGADAPAAVLTPILQALQEPFNYLGHSLDCRASVGAALFPDQGGSPDELMKNADLALYSAKLSRRGGITMFAPAMRSELQDRLSMLNLARDALREDLILPFYQPQVDLRTGAVSGFEALLRWRHPARGIQMPATIAEAFGDVALARQVGERMQEQVFADMRRWLDGGKPFGRVSINTSAAEFRNDDFAESLLARLTKARIPHEHVEVEITEKTIFQGKNSEYVARALRVLRASRVRVALDDFGTGFSSLSHLKEFAVDALKIDQSFIRGLGATPDSDDTAIVLAVLNLGRSLNIEVVAEGVETVRQADFLRANGCNTGQGFLFGKAMPAEEVSALLETPAARAASL
ncbi:PAS domain-containing protein [Sphingosinicella sp. CPCC 101087]|uniref:PAS domain-containing protein n=1 Tax=Sphingosinicella sp. CPCC 101087 TaxID=2497754 RepID=UPI00101BCCBA|nr:PAS domain-containing protein [Sphingosinicella sp. CPCC 101087]